MTVLPEAARALAQRSLPCIFLESAEQQESVWGVDLVLREDALCLQKTDNGQSRMPESNCEYVVRELGEEALVRLWQRHYGLPWMIAQTKRLLIRESVMEDLPAFLAMYGDEADNPDVVPFKEHPEETFYSYTKRQYPLYGYGLWTVAEQSSGAVAGRIGVENEEAGGWQLAYLIARQYRRRGYAKEAAEAVLAYARDVLELPYLKLHTSDSNIASQKLAVSLGFQKTSVFGNSYTIDLTSL